MVKSLKFFSIYFMGLFYLSIGIKHFTDPDWFVRIVPPILPYKIELVYISGFFEVVFGILLVIKHTRYYAGIGLIILLIEYGK